MSQEQSTRNQSPAKARKQRRVRQGTVVSDKRNKTIKVEVTYLEKHPRYGKYMRKRTVLHAHDETNDAHVGDVVQVMECRPISKTKQWRLLRVVKRNPLIQAASQQGGSAGRPED